MHQDPWSTDLIAPIRQRVEAGLSTGGDKAKLQTFQKLSQRGPWRFTATVFLSGMDHVRALEAPLILPEDPAAQAAVRQVLQQAADGVTTFPAQRAIAVEMLWRLLLAKAGNPLPRWRGELFTYPVVSDFVSLRSVKMVLIPKLKTLQDDVHEPEALQTLSALHFCFHALCILTHSLHVCKEQQPCLPEPMSTFAPPCGKRKDITAGCVEISLKFPVRLLPQCSSCLLPFRSSQADGRARHLVSEAMERRLGTC